MGYITRQDYYFVCSTWTFGCWNLDKSLCWKRL